jgi:DNA-binding NarL/FixJ family response regulator
MGTPEGTDEQASETAADGLTRREADVLQLVSRGMRNREIGDELHLSEKTVKVHMTAILRKLGVTNRTQAAIVAHAALTQRVA